MAKYKLTYEYVNPSRGGPFRGKDVVELPDKPLRGDVIAAMFGAARIKSVSLVKENNDPLRTNP